MTKRIVDTSDYNYKNYETFINWDKRVTSYKGETAASDIYIKVVIGGNRKIWLCLPTKHPSHEGKGYTQLHTHACLYVHVYI